MPVDADAIIEANSSPPYASRLSERWQVRRGAALPADIFKILYRKGRYILPNPQYSFPLLTYLPRILGNIFQFHYESFVSFYYV